MLAIASAGAAALSLALAGCGSHPADALPRAAAIPSDRALVWAVGDGDAGAKSAALVRRIRSESPDLFLYLGDVYPNGRAGDFARNYDPTFGQLAKRTAPTPGNHDWSTGRQGYLPYWKRVKGKRQRFYYSLRAGGWTLLSLNSETAHGRGSRQLRWLRRRLRTAGTCRLAFWHRPRYSAGVVHGDAPDVDPFWRTLSGHTRLVLNGHEHDSQRLRRRRGITELIAGAGGHGLYGIRAGDPRLLFSDDRHYAALRLTLEPGRAEFAFVTSAGRVLDSGSVRCRAGD